MIVSSFRGVGFFSREVATAATATTIFTVATETSGATKTPDNSTRRQDDGDENNNGDDNLVNHSIVPRFQRDQTSIPLNPQLEQRSDLIDDRREEESEKS